jgi:hypothetical protein
MRTIARGLVLCIALSGCGRLGFDESPPGPEPGGADAGGRPDPGGFVDAGEPAGDAIAPPGVPDAASDNAPDAAVPPDPGTPGVIQASAVDTAIIEADPTQNFGSVSTMKIDAGSRALIRFDLSAVPAGSTVTSCRMQLWVVKGGDTNGNVRMFRLLEEWQEGAGNTSGATGAASWSERLPGVPWSDPGAGPRSREAIEVSSNSLDNDPFQGNYGASFPMETATCQDWVNNPAANFGMVFVADGYVSTFPEIGASEFNQAHGHPVLRVEYTP